MIYPSEFTQLLFFPVNYLLVDSSDLSTRRKQSPKMRRRRRSRWTDPLPFELIANQLWRLTTCPFLFATHFSWAQFRLLVIGHQRRTVKNLQPPTVSLNLHKNGQTIWAASAQTFGLVQSTALHFCRFLHIINCDNAKDKETNGSCCSGDRYFNE